MTEEEMQKKMEFILEQQAQFAINIELLREAQQRTETHLAEVATAQARMARSQTHMNEVVAVIRLRLRSEWLKLRNEPTGRWRRRTNS